MAQTETFDPKRYTPFAAGRAHRRRAEHVPEHRHRRRPHQVLAGSRAHRQRDGPRRGHPHVPGGRPRVHPALAASIPLAHRLHPAADRGDAAHRRRDLADARPEEPDRAGVHRHRTERGNRRRDRAAEGVSHRWLPGHGARAVPDHRSAGRGVGGAPAGGARRRTLQEPAPALREAARAGTGLPVRRRLPTRVARPLARCRRSSADLAVGESVRPLARAEARPSTPTTPAVSARAACWRADWSKRARATSKSPPSTFRSATGIRTRTATSARRR